MAHKKTKKSETREMKSKEKHPSKGSSSAARAMWRGSISFGLVNIPVRLYGAIEEKKIRFHLFSEKEECRVRQQLVCEGTEKVVDRSKLIKGYESHPGHFIVVTKEELQKIAPKSSRTIEILQFTDLKQIDPIYFNKPYYLLPEPNARKAYALFCKALEQSQKVGLAKLVLYERENLVALRIMDHCICLETLHFYNEVRDVHNLPESDQNIEIQARELNTAIQLIDSLSKEFAPKTFHDEYRDRVLDLLKRKEQGKKIIITPEAEEEGAEVVDLMSALEASLKKAKQNKKAA